MSGFFNFGMYKGKTQEWIFFHAPWYAKWIHDKGIHEQGNIFDEHEAAHFLGLYNRASKLAGTCELCNRPVRRMGLTFLCSGSLGSVGFYCEQCEYLGGSRTQYEPPSFFIESRRLPRNAQKMITKAIQHHYIKGKLTRKNIEAFFGNNDHFSI